jgi:hypothetical protein
MLKRRVKGGVIQSEVAATASDGRLSGDAINQATAIQLFSAFLRLGITAFGGAAISIFVL